MPRKPLRLGVLGGQRGGSFTVALEHFKNRIKLAAVCDRNPEVLSRWTKQHPGIAAFEDWHAMLRAEVCDAVIVATPMDQHAAQSIEAMRAGLHVLSEVTACTTHREALALIEAVKKTGRIFMMAENYCYSHPAMMIRNMIEKGLFGDLTYAEGMYLHDCRSIAFESDGALTWRGRNKRDLPGGNCYPTHSLGPIAQWMGINHADRIDTVYSVSAAPHSIAAYARDRFGARHPGAKISHWKLGDSNSVVIRTKLGRVIYLRFDSNSLRPHDAAAHELQGTSAAFRTVPDHREPLIWIDGLSPGGEAKGRKARGNVSSANQWENLSKYAPQFEHPRWKKLAAVAKKAGHGGGDFFELEDFLDACEGRRPSAIDVIDAVTWSSIIWISQKSEKTGRAEKAYDYTQHR